MPTKRRAGKARLLDDYRRQQLLEGPDACLLAGVGYLGPYRAATFGALTDAERAEAREEMRADWLHHGGEMLERWRRGEYEPGMKPWAFVVPGGLDRDPWALREFGAPTLTRSENDHA